MKPKFLLAYVVLISLIATRSHGQDQSESGPAQSDLSVCFVEKIDKWRPLEATVSVRALDDGGVVQHLIPFRSIGLDVTDSEGKPAALTLYGDRLKNAKIRKSSGATAIYIEPNTDFTFDLMVSRYFDLSMGGTFYVQLSLTIKIGDETIVLKGKKQKVLIAN